MTVDTTSRWQTNTRKGRELTTNGLGDNPSPLYLYCTIPHPLHFAFIMIKRASHHL
jgi:hypothetical protein